LIIVMIIKKIRENNFSLQAMCLPGEDL